MTTTAPVEIGGELLFVRHGATEPNLAGLRCGGDLDVPLVPLGLQQAQALIPRIASLQPPVGLIVTSALERTRATAEVIASALGLPVVVEPLFAERRLGAWNRLPLDETAPWLESDAIPPGGESNAEFTARVACGLARVQPLLPRRPLLVASRGVARVLGELTGAPPSRPAGNAELIVFRVAAPSPAHPAGGSA
jgi:2,3-bisphosphoglycerate-dependent phosphoglycerate mutase